MNYDNYDRLDKAIRDFCRDCEYVYDCGGSEEFWGATVHMPEYTCDAEFDPDWKKCPRHEEYEELLDEMAEEERKLDEAEDAAV